MKKVYFVLTFSGTFLGYIIKIKTNEIYSHVSIALDEELHEMYSFSRLRPYNCFVGGFVHEELNKGSYKRFKNTKSKICYIEVTDEQYEKLREQINEFIIHKSIYKFDIFALACILFNKKIKHRKNYFYCAEFVKYCLDNSGININLPEIPKPEHFEHIENSTTVYTGLLNKYKVKQKL